MKLLLFVLYFISLSNLYSQNIDLSYVNPASIEIGGTQQKFSFFIQNNTSDEIDINSLLTISLPSGIVYTDNSVSTNFSLVNIIDANTYVFSYNNNINIGEKINLVFFASANCEAYQYVTNESLKINNIISYDYTVNGIKQNVITLDETDNYNLSFNSIDLNIPINNFDNALIANQTQQFTNTSNLLSQELDISISGNSLNFSVFKLNIDTTDYIDLIGISRLYIDSKPFDVSNIVIDNSNSLDNISTLIFNASYLDSSVLHFSSDVSIKIFLDYRANSCFENESQHIVYTSLIDDCLLSKATGDFQYIINNPILNYSFSSDNGINFCEGNSSVTYTMNNSISNSNPVYDIKFRLNFLDGINVSNITINNIPINLSDFTDNLIYLSGNKYPGLISEKSLSDEDNDGYFDDLAPGSSLIFKCTVSIDDNSVLISEDDCNISIDSTYFQTDFFSVNSLCDSTYFGDNGLKSFFKIKDKLEVISLSFDNDFEIDKVNNVNLCFERYGSGDNTQLYDDSFLIEANIFLPNNLSINEGSLPIFTTDDGTTLKVSSQILFIDNKRVLNFKVLEPYFFNNSTRYYGGCFEFDLIIDENPSNEDQVVSSPFLEAFLVGSFSECSINKINLGCVSKEVFLHISPITSCPVPTPFVATDFDVTRTTYGNYIDGSSITIENVDKGVYEGLNTKGAYASDDIRASITSTAYCDVSNIDILYGYIWFDHLENESILSLSSANYSVNSSGLLDVHDFKKRFDLSTSLKSVYEIQIANQALNKGDVVEINGHFSVNKSINNNNNFPNVYSFSDFRGGTSITPNLPLNPLNFGADFEVYSLNYSSEIYGNPASCSKNGNLYFSFWAIGGEMDDFVNEYRDVIKIDGPIEISISDYVDETIRFMGAKLNGMPLHIEPVDDKSGVFRIYDIDYKPTMGFKSQDKISTRNHSTIQIKYQLIDCSQNEIQKVTANAAYFSNAYTDESSLNSIKTNFYPRRFSIGNGFTEGDLSLDVVNPFFQSVNNKTRYKIDVINSSSSSASFPWIKFTYPSDKVFIDNSSIDGYDIIGQIYTKDELLLKLKPINANTKIEGFVEVLLNNCSLTDQNIDIFVETGISCLDLDEFNSLDNIELCPLDSNKKIQLEVIESNLRMDVIPLFNEDVLLEYCESFQYVIQIFNNQKANISDTNFKVDIPQGFDMKLQYLYPVTESIDPNNFSFLNSNFSLPLTIQNNQYWELDVIDGVLPGFIANNDEKLFNYYHLLVSFTPNCDFDGISPFEFSTKGTTNCNDIKEIKFTSTPKFKRIEEINDFSQNLSLNIQEDELNNNYIATINYEYLSEITDLLGFIKITLPNGTYSNSDLQFELPLNKTADYKFNFSVDSDFCQDIIFDIETVIELDLSCNENDSCFKNYSFKENLIDNICVQPCEISDIAILVSNNDIVSCLNYSLLASLPLINKVDITLYDWKIYDIYNKLIKHSTEEQLNIDLPAYGGPFNVILNVKGMNSHGMICENDTSININPICNECDLSADFEIEILNDCTFKFLNTSNHSLNDNIKYLWDFGDGVTSSEFEPTHIFTDENIFSVSLSISTLNVFKDCNSSSVIKQIKSLPCIPNYECTNIIQNTNLNLYPNPSNGIFKLSFDNCISYFKISIYNTVGKVVYNSAIRNNNEAIIDMSNNAKGVYIMSISNNNSSINKRVIIQ
jgi:hypothetical protein